MLTSYSPKYPNLKLPRHTIYRIRKDAKTGEKQRVKSERGIGVRFKAGKAEVTEQQAAKLRNLPDSLGITVDEPPKKAAAGKGDGGSDS